MQFTLDSIEQFKASLLEIHKGKKAFVKPVLFNDLKRLYTDNQPNGTFYFGILTVGKNVPFCILRDENENQIIEITSNSQIIDYFCSLTCQDDEMNPVFEPEGHFRGFEIDLR